MLNAISVFVFTILTLAPAVHAMERVTHTARLDLELSLINEKGKNDKLNSKDGKVSMNWDTGECELVTKDAHYPCKLDISQDLLGRNGEILIKSLPTIQFDQKTLDQMLMALGSSNKKSSNLIYYAVKESSASRAQGFVVPWYAVREEQEFKPGESVQFWSGFAGLYVELNIRAQATLGLSRSFNLQFFLHDLKAIPGSFDIIGNNHSGNFGN